MNAIIYCRVSSKDQVDNYSLPLQEKICREYAKRCGYEVIEIFVEKGESAKTIDRTQLKKLLDFISKNHKRVNAIIVPKLDRLARNMIDFTGLVASFSKLGIDIKSATENVDDSPAGKLTKNMIAAIAQFDNDVRSERTRGGMREAIQEGRWCWRAPVGLKQSKDIDDKTLLVPSEESLFIVEAFNLFTTGLYTQVDIMKMLRKKGFKRLTKGLLNRILRNPLYCGLIKVDWHPNYIPAKHKGIIPQEVFLKAQYILTGRKPSITPKTRNHPDFPLRNFVRCPKCGQGLTAGWSTGRKKVKYAYYHCRTKGCSLNVKKQDLEAKFYSYLKSFQPNQDTLVMFEAIVLDVWKAKQEEQIKEEFRLEKELKELQSTKDRIDELMIKNVFDEATYKQKAEEINNEIMVKRIELNETKIELADIEACLNFAKFFIANVADLWINGELDLKQRFQTLLFPDKIYYESGKFRTTQTSLIFKQLQTNPIQQSDLVAPTGFEPVFIG